MGTNPSDSLAYCMILIMACCLFAIDTRARLLNKNY